MARRAPRDQQQRGDIKVDLEWDLRGSPPGSWTWAAHAQARSAWSAKARTRFRDGVAAVYDDRKTKTYSDQEDFVPSTIMAAHGVVIVVIIVGAVSAVSGRESPRRRRHRRRPAKNEECRRT